MSVLEIVRKQLRRYRDLLANLSRKNRELYFKEARGSTLNLSKKPNVEPEFEELAEEKFRPLRITSPELAQAIESGILDLSKHFLLSEINNPELHKRLDKIRLADDKFKREFGISGAWLLGPFLLWRDTQDFKPGELLISPILKLPIDLAKDKKKQWKLKLEESEFSVNPSLKLALKMKWGIELPDTFQAKAPQGVIDQLTKILADSEKTLNILGPSHNTIPKVPPRYKVIKDENGDITDRQPVNFEESLSKEEIDIYRNTTDKVFTLIDVLYIDQLNASRAVLISDYDSILESSDLHPILSELFLGKPIPGERTIGREKIRALDSYKEKENYFVVDIDSTQHRAIDKVSATRAVVIQGPPGTGKSQTITNLIASNLAKGKKVLFVSEKRSALDVVSSRLRQANLAAQTVLIHSSDLNKQDLYKSFLALSNSVHDRTTDKTWHETTAELDTVKSEINSYYDFLGTEHLPSQLAVSELLTLFAGTTGTSSNVVLFSALKHLTYTELNSAAERLSELGELVKGVPNYAKHPWLNRKPGTIFSETFEQTQKALFLNLNNAEKVWAELRSSLKTVSDKESIDAFPPREETEFFLKREYSEKFLANSTQFLRDPSAIGTLENALSVPLEEMSKLTKEFTLIKKDSDPELVRQLEVYYTLKRGIMDWLTLTFWKFRRLRKEICPKWNGTSSSFSAFREMGTQVKKVRSIFESYHLEIYWDPTAPAGLRDSWSEARSALRDITHTGVFLRRLGQSFSEKYSVLTNENLSKMKTEVQSFLDLHSKALQQRSLITLLHKTLNTQFSVPLSLELDCENAAFYQILLESMRDLDSLDRVELHLEHIKKFTRGLDSKGIITLLLPCQEKWGGQCKAAVIRGWLDEFRAQFPVLRTFESNGFTAKIAKFRTLEKDHCNAARDTVNNTLFQRWNHGTGEGEGLSLLTKESDKQRRVLSPREIMEKGALSAMMKLKPCWLMSPLSISQMLPLQAGLFDVIIFDEASQVRLEDAVPSIYRCNSMVVVGDPKQMPPTNFFSGTEVNEDEEFETDIAPSILDMASLIYPSEMLEWHYRSRSEALIAFSNRAFYGGRLICVPNPHLITSGDAIHYYRVNDAFFSQKDGNIREAETVVETAYRLLRENPAKSLGMIAMGQSQMLAIQNVIEQRKITDKAFGEVFDSKYNFKDGDADAGLFVRNLENVQGDERDIILLSIGYAPPNKEKKLRLGFGPLSIPGGGRRLNVAITRAKQQVHVFTSFDPNEIPSDEAAFSKNPDTVVFARYLKFARAVAESRHAEAQIILDSFGVGAVMTARKGSNFSKDVQRRLAELGYQVSAEIGSSGFYIDLAIHHPVIPQNFILGIECDGAMFHSMPYARDRDKIREDLLTSRGWNIERIWSQDWSKDWKSEIARLDKAIKALLTGQHREEN